MASLPELIECSRLTLRRWAADDVPLMRVAITESLDHLLPWMDWASHEPLADDARRSLVEHWDELWQAGSDAVYGAFVGDEIVGGCGLHRRAGADTLDIGYWIHVSHVGHGYATELAAGLTTAAFTVSGIERVAIHHDQANVVSGRVPARLGFRCDGETPSEVTAPGQVGIDVAWSIGRDEWLARTAGT